MAETFTVTSETKHTFAVERCCKCHIPFAMTAELVAERKADHKLFYCPKGHSQFYVIRCKLCHKKLSSKQSLARHMRAIHGATANKVTTPQVTP